MDANSQPVVADISEDRRSWPGRSWDLAARLSREKRSRQILGLFGTTIFLRAFSFITAPITTRTLGPYDYGQLAVYGSVTGFPLLFFSFGFFSTTGTLLAKSTNEQEQRNLIGASLVVAIVLGLVYAACIFALSFFVDDWFQVWIGSMLRYIFPFLVFFPLLAFVPLIGRGTNRIDSIVWVKAFPVLASFGLIVFLWLAGALALESLIPLRASLAVFSLVIIFWIFKPSFANLRGTLRLLFRKNREFGIHMYAGQIVSEGTSRLDGIMIPLFVGPTELGYYALALTLSRLIPTFSRALTTSQYRQYAQQMRIPRKTFWLNYCYLVLACLALVVLGGPLLIFIAGDRFAGAVPLVPPLALMVFFAGAYLPYNSFLSANGCGKWMRNAALAMTAVSLVGNLSLIPPFGALGAAWASVLAMGVCYAVVLHYYRRFCRGDHGKVARGNG